MDHVAIMRKSWGLTQKILTGEKRIESRWYKSKYAPWEKIKSGETIYFKDSGAPVALKARVSRVLQFSDLNPTKVKKLLTKYGKGDGIAKKDLPKYYQMFKNRRYCLLIFLKNPVRINPFNIDKAGYGAMAAWLTVKKIEEVKKVI